MAIKHCQCIKKSQGWTKDTVTEYWVCADCRRPSYAALWGPYPPIKASSTRTWYSHDIPPHRFSNIVCTCDTIRQPGKLAFAFDQEKHVNLCFYCRKYPASSLFDCEECGRTNLKDFNHLAYCRRHPLCWSDLDHSLNQPACGCRPTDFVFAEFCPQPPWTTVNRVVEVDLKTFDPFAPIF